MTRIALTLAALLASAPAYAAVLNIDAAPDSIVTANWNGVDDVSVRFLDFAAEPRTYTVHLIGAGVNGSWDLVWESTHSDPHVMAGALTDWDFDRADSGWTLVQSFAHVGECLPSCWLRRTWAFDAASNPPPVNPPPPPVSQVPEPGGMLLGGLLALAGIVMRRARW